MRVTLTDGKIYDARWKRSINRKFEGESLTDTFCYISEVMPGVEGRDKYREISSGVTFLGNKDVKAFKKSKGRKLSLARALKDKFSRNERILFWLEYQSSCKN